MFYRFLYCEEVYLTGDSVMQVLYASKKYILPTLTEKCSAFLKDNLDTGNVCVILDQAMSFNEVELVEKCMAIVRNNTEDILKSVDFATASPSVLERILQCDELSSSEIELFKAYHSWAKNKCQQKGEASGDDCREVLGNLLYKIRFPNMSLGDFSTFVSPSGILSKDEEIQCYRYIGNPASIDTNEIPFNTHSRKKPESIKMLHPLNANNVGVVNNDTHQTTELRYLLSSSFYAKIVGFRISCIEGDVPTLSMRTDQKIVTRLQAGTIKIQAAQNVFGGSSLPLANILNKHKITRTNKEANIQFEDIYFEDNKLQLAPDHTCELKVLFHASQSPTSSVRSALLAQNLVFQKNSSSNLVCGSPFFGGSYGQPQHTMCIVGIFVLSEK